MLAVLGIVAFFAALIFQFVVLFTGRYPEGGHKFRNGRSAYPDAWHGPDGRTRHLR